MNNINVQNKGFSEYEYPEGYQSFPEYKSALKTQLIVKTIFYFSVVVALSIVLVPAFTLHPILGIVVAVALLELARRGVKSTAHLIALRKLVPPNLEQIEEINDIPSATLGNNSLSIHSAIPYHDSEASNRMKLEMIKSAQHHFFLSGSYLGNEFGDEALDTIKEQLQNKPSLKGTILVSDFFLTDSNKRKLQEIRELGSGRVDVIVCPENYTYINPNTNELALSLNHVKAVVVDYGQYFMVGGSGLTNRWTSGQQTEPGTLGLPNPRLMLPNRYVDSDYAVHSPLATGTGRCLYKEGMKLAAKWKYLTTKNHEKLCSLGAIPNTILTRIPNIDNNSNKIPGVSLQMFASGPEHNKNHFLKKMIEDIDQATESIEISHMYFHPNKALLDALIRASNRGITITINTNGSESGSPYAHKTWHKRSQLFWEKLYEGIAKENVKIYRYLQPNKTVHDKLILVDKKKAYIGSGNLSHRSLDLIDDELHFVAESPLLGNNLHQMFTNRISSSKEIPLQQAYTPSRSATFFGNIQALLGMIF